MAIENELATQTTLGNDDWIRLVANKASAPASKLISYVDFLAALSGVNSAMLNGQIVPSVASNNLTLALKTAAGSDPSATDRVYVWIGGVMRAITAPLSVTLNAGTNWMSLGSAELATLPADLFPYLGYNATDGVVLGFSRIPYASQYFHFSTTATNELYAGISTITNAAAGDVYVNIGRFAATLSAGAGYTWTVPTFTASNLIQRPIYETRWRDWVPTRAGYSANPTNTVCRYKVDMFSVYLEIRETTNGTHDATTNNPTYTAPFTALTLTNMSWLGMAWSVDNNALGAMGHGQVNSASNSVSMYKSASAAWTASQPARVAILNMSFEIAAI